MPVALGDGDEVSGRLNKGLPTSGSASSPRACPAMSPYALPEVNTWDALTLNQSPLAGKNAIRPGSSGWNPSSSPGNPTEWHISQWMRRHFSELNIAATYNLLYNASILVRKGLGTALGLDRLINVKAAPEICFRPCEPALPLALYFAWRKQNVFSPAARAFLSMVLARFTTV